MHAALLHAGSSSKSMVRAIDSLSSTWCAAIDDGVYVLRRCGLRCEVSRVGGVRDDRPTFSFKCSTTSAPSQELIARRALSPEKSALCGETASLAPKVFEQWYVALSGAPATSGVFVNGFKLTLGTMSGLSHNTHSFVQYISSGCTWQHATRALHLPRALCSRSFLRLRSSIACVSGVNRSTPPRTTRFFVRTKENERASTPQPQTQFRTGAPPGRLFFGFPVAVIVTHP